MTNPFTRRWWVGESKTHEHMSWSKDLESLKSEMSGSPDAEFFEVVELPSEGMGLAIHEQIVTEVAAKAACKWADRKKIALDSEEMELAVSVGLACAKSQLEGNLAALKHYKGLALFCEQELKSEQHHNQFLQDGYEKLRDLAEHLDAVLRDIGNAVYPRVTGETQYLMNDYDFVFRKVKQAREKFDKCKLELEAGDI